MCRLKIKLWILYLVSCIFLSNSKNRPSRLASVSFCFFHVISHVYLNIMENINNSTILHQWRTSTMTPFYNHGEHQQWHHSPIMENTNNDATLQNDQEWDTMATSLPGYHGHIVAWRPGVRYHGHIVAWCLQGILRSFILDEAQWHGHVTTMESRGEKFYNVVLSSFFTYITERFTNIRMTELYLVTSSPLFIGRSLEEDKVVPMVTAVRQQTPGNNCPHQLVFSFVFLLVHCKFLNNLSLKAVDMPHDSYMFNVAVFYKIWLLFIHISSDSQVSYTSLLHI